MQHSPPARGQPERLAPRLTPRLGILIGILGVLLALLPLCRRFLAPPLQRPAANAAPVVQLNYLEQRIAASPTDASAYLQSGRIEEAQGFFLAAVQNLLTARSLGAPDRETAPPLGRAYLHLVRYDQARVELRKAAQLNGDVESAVNLAGFYDAVGEDKGAAETLNSFLHAHPRLSLEETARLMLCYGDIGNGAGAFRMAESLTTLAPKSPAGWAVAGRCLLDAGHSKKAKSYLKRALALAPQENDLHFQYGRALLAQGDAGGAIREWTGAFVRDDSQFDVCKALGDLLMRRQRYAQAAYVYSRVAIQAKNSIQAAMITAHAYERAGKPESAAYWRATAAGWAKDFPTALRLSQQLRKSKDAAMRRRGLAGVAEAYRGMHRRAAYLQAILEFTKAQTPEDLLIRSDAYVAVEDYPKQEECLRQALAKDPSLLAPVHHRLYDSYLQRGMRDQAESELQQAVAAEPDDAMFQRELGSLYFERRDQGDRLQRAITAYEAARRLAPSSYLECLHLGIAEEAANDLPEAAAHLEHAVDLQPGYGPAYLELSHVYTRLKQKDAGRQAIALYRQYARYDQTRQTLKSRTDAGNATPADFRAYGDFLAQAGDAVAARREYRQAREHGPKIESAAAAANAAGQPPVKG